MVTRTRIEDRRYTVTSSQGDMWLAGAYESRVQLGADKAPSKRKPDLPPPVLEKQGETIRWAEFVRNGTKPSRAYGEEHPYVATFVKEFATPGVWTQTVYNSDGTLWYRNVVENPPQSGNPFFQTYDPTPDLRIDCVAKLREKLGGLFNAGVAAAEAATAIDMIAVRTKQLVYGIRYLRRGNWRAAARAFGVSPRNTKRERATPESLWLELQYGWLPLLQDIRGGAEFLAHHLNVPLQWRFKTRSSTSANWDRNPGYSGGTALTRLQLVAILNEQPDIAQLGGLLDPLTVAWEAAPFSFVGDWLWPLGAWLEARDTISSLNATYVVTRTDRVNYDGRAGGFPPFANTATHTQTFTGLHKTVYVHTERTVGDNFSLPLPNVTKPSDVFKSWTRAANAVALVVAMTR